jgi:crotonobetainyl-CoA:carnitine CoA-transferase CaiB-like acyl-CoA transferase
MYESADGHVLFMASEQAFWKNFADGIGRPELFEKWPGSKYADHAKGNLELQAILKEVFVTKTSLEWLDFADEHNVPIAPVNNAKNIVDDPQFRDRFPLYTVHELGAEQLPLPVFVQGEARRVPSRAPDVGQHTDEVMAEVLGYDAAKVDELRAAGAFGSP